MPSKDQYYFLYQNGLGFKKVSPHTFCDPKNHKKIKIHKNIKCNSEFLAKFRKTENPK